MWKIFLALFLIFLPVANFVAQITECDADDAEIARYNNEKSIKPDPGKTFLVPVIVHVLYNNSAENVTDSGIRAMLNSLQEDFSGTNADYANIPDEFRERAGIPNIRFHLATELSDGKPTTGIIRKKTKIKFFSGKYKRSMFTESKIVDGSRFLNIYVCDYRKGANGVGGFG